MTDVAAFDLWLPGVTPYRREPEIEIRKTKGGRHYPHHYPHELTEKGMSRWRSAWLQHPDRPYVTGPVVVMILSKRRRRAGDVLADGVTLSASGQRSPFPDTAPDLDNIAKIALDALKGMAIDDDAAVVDLVLRKRWVMHEAQEGTSLRVMAADPVTLGDAEGISVDQLALDL